ncbi:MAG: TlpA family protein disulfide reductase [Gammaproteobacteria bacterium]
MVIRFFLLALPVFLVPSWSFAVQVGESAPQCAVMAGDNNAKFDFSAYRGKVVLIDFWATWCPPCKKSMPFLDQLRNDRLADGLEVLAINVDEISDEAKAFLNNNPTNYPMFFDPDGNCPKAFDVKAMPSSYLLDKSGIVRHIHFGFRDEDKSAIIEQISQLLAE